MSKVVIGKPAPAFSKMAVLPNGKFQKISLSDYLGKWVVLFFYPLDFTFVCPTEIIEFSEQLKKFEEIDTVVLGTSVDSEYSHLAWRKTDRKKGGLGKIDFPLVSDLSKSMSKDYGVLFNDEVALRGLFVIDPKGILRTYIVHALEVGRNVEEVLRIVDALQFHDKHGHVCPVNWNKKKKSLDPEKSEEYFEKEY